MKALRTSAVTFCLLLFHLVWWTALAQAQTNIPSNTTINGNTTWTMAGSPYVVEGPVNVEGSAGAVATLTIEPGVEVRFRPNGILRVGQNGRGALMARGSPATPIRFTADTAAPEPGHWFGIFLGDRAEDSSILEHLIVEYAGRNNQAALDIRQSSPTLRNATVRHNGRAGIALTDASPLITATQVVSNTDAGIVLSQASPTIINCTLSGNRYGLFSDRSSPTLQENSSSGNDLYGFYFRNQTNATLTANTVLDSLYFENGAGNSSLTDNAISAGSGQPPRINANQIGALLAANEIGDLRAAGRIEVLGESITQDAIWLALGVPYRILNNDLRVGASGSTLVTLTLAPGAELQFDRDRRLLVGDQGPSALVATGTFTQPITFTTAARFPQVGDWLGLYFGPNTNLATTQLAHLLVSHAGRRDQQPSIWFDRTALTLRDSVVQRGAGWGIRVTNATAVISHTQVLTTAQTGLWAERSNLTLADSLLQNNQRGIYLTQASPRLIGNRILRPQLEGIFAEGQTNAFLTDNIIEGGFYFQNGGTGVTLQNNTVASIPERPLRIGAAAVGMLFAQNVVENRDNLALEVVGETISQHVTWPSLDAPYRIVSSDIRIEGSSSVSASLTLEPGVELQFGSRLRLITGQNGRGALIAVGTTTDPITFSTSASVPRPGDWPGLFFGAQTDTATTQLRHLIVAYAGTRDQTPSIWFERAPLTLQDSLIHHGDSWGIRASNTTTTISNTQVLTTARVGVWAEGGTLTLINSLIENNPNGVFIQNATATLTGNRILRQSNYGFSTQGRNTVNLVENLIEHGLFLRDANTSVMLRNNHIILAPGEPLRVGANTVGVLLAENEIEGLSANQWLEVVGEVINQNAMWPALAIPYRIVDGDVRVEASGNLSTTLTIAPGAELQFSRDRRLIVGERGSSALVAMGTAASPIVFTTTAQIPRPGDWSGLSFGPQTNAAATQLAHLLVAYAGVRDRSPAIWFNNAAVQIRDTLVRDSDGWGIRVNNAAAVIASVQISNVAQSAILAQQSSLTLRDSLLQNNEYGVYIQSASPTITGNRISGSRQYGFFVEGQTNATLRNNTIDQGIFFRDSSAGVTLIDNQIIFARDKPVRIGANVVGALFAQNTLENFDAIGQFEVVGEIVNRNAHWPALAMPYRIINNDLRIEASGTASATLTLAPGTELRFDAARRLVVGQQGRGALVALGEPTHPITFTTSVQIPRPGDWSGLYFGRQTVTDATQLAHLVVTYAGVRNQSSSIWFDQAAVQLRDSIVQNSDAWGIRVSNASALISNTQIISTAQSGLLLQQSNSTIANTLFTNNEYGIYLQSSSPTITGNQILRPQQYGTFVENQTAATITGNTIEHGIFFRDGSAGARIVDNQISDLDQFPLRIGANTWGEFWAENSLTGLGNSPFIELIGERLTMATVWDDVGPPYIIRNNSIEVWRDNVPITLTLSAGVQLKFDDRSSLFVGSNNNRPGTLIARGTVAAPVVFTSLQTRPRPGDWRGIDLRQGTTNSTLLDHVMIEYGIDNLTITGASPSLTNSTLRFGAANGLRASSFSLADVRNNTIVGNSAYGISLSNFANLRIRGNTIEHGIMTGTSGDTSQPVITENRFINYRGGFPIKIPFVSASGDLRSNRFEGTDAASHIQLYGAETDLTLNLTLPDLGLPYVVVEKDLNISRDGVLTIEPGVELRFSRGLGITVRDNGRLVAQGGVERPIVFTAAESFPTAGAWRGITLNARQRSFLANCLVQFAGGDTTRGAVHVAAANNPVAESIIQGCRIERSLAHGLTVDRTQPLVTATQFVANGGFDLYNIPNANRRPVMAILNWWERTEGPSAVGDDGSNGVSDGVTINPWLGEPSNADLFQRAEVISPQFSPAGGQARLLATLAASATWTMTVFDVSGTAVSLTTGEGSTVMASWDGQTNGAPLPAGVYPFHLLAQSATGTTAALAGQLTLDPTLPAASLTAPAIGSTVTPGVIEVRGTATATDLQRYRLEYAPATAPGARTLITQVNASAVSAGVLVQWNTTSLLSGDYLLYLTAETSGGRQSVTHIPLTIDSMTITEVAVSSHTLNPQASERITISYRLSERAAVTVAVGEHLALAGTLQEAGVHRVIWNGRNAAGNSVEEGAYFFTIEARAPNGRRGVYVELPTPQLLELPTQSVIQNRVDGTLQVTYAPTQPVNILLAFGTPPRSGATGALATVVAHAPRGPGRQAEVWQYTNPENFTPRMVYHLPPLLAVAVSGGGGGGGGGGGARAVVFIILPPPPFPPPPAPPPKNFNPRAEYLVNLDAWVLPDNVIIVRSPPFDIKPVFAEPAVIIPTFGQAAEIEYTLSHSAQVTVELFAPDSATGLTLVRSLQRDVEQASGTHAVLWDGRNADGRVVSTGRYIYVITATGPAGQTRTRRGEIRVAF